MTPRKREHYPNNLSKTINLNKAEQTIYDFLDNRLGVYKNRPGVEFCVNNDDSVHVNYWIKDAPMQDTCLEFGLCYTSSNFNHFISDFGFTGLKQLRAFTSDDLWEMYYKGQVEFYCLITGKKIYFALYFRLEDNKIIVHDDHDHVYKPDEILQTPFQFMQYTQQQFLHYKGPVPKDHLG
jgi:hypothetical protein